MAEHRHPGLPAHVRYLGLIQTRQCQLPHCCCPHGLLFVWREGYRGRSRTTLEPVLKSRVCWELRTRDGQRFQGGAPTEADAERYGAMAMAERGLTRMRVVSGRPVEVARA